MGINHNEIANEFRKKLKDGEVHLSEPEDLMKYVVALANQVSGQAPESIQRSAQIEYLNTCLNIKTLNKVDNTINKTDTTIKNLEETIKKLDKKNSRLSMVVVILAIFTVLTGIAQLWFSYTSNETVSKKITQYNQVQEKQLLHKSNSEISGQLKASSTPQEAPLEQQKKQGANQLLPKKEIDLKETSQNNLEVPKENNQNKSP